MTDNNITTYLTFRGDLTFRQSPFNDLDAAILATIIGLDFTDLDLEDKTFAELKELYFAPGRTLEEDDYLTDKEELLTLIASSKRFAKIHIHHFVKEIDTEAEKTFYAMTYVLDFFHRYIVFRGTDGGLISWKENFNTIYEFPTPGQTRAREYVKEVVDKPWLRFALGGHSKGANLANYAALTLEDSLQKKLTAVYSLDGPGFIDDIQDYPSYGTFVDKLHAYIPEESLFGRIMNVPYPVTVVKSFGKGLFQHDVFTWQVNATGFETVEKPNEFSDELTKKVNDWINGIPMESRKDLVDELFKVFDENGIDHVDRLLHMNLKSILGIIRSATRLSPENRGILIIIITSLKGRH